MKRSDLIESAWADPSSNSGGGGDDHLDNMSDRQWILYAASLGITLDRALRGVRSSEVQADVRRALRTGVVPEWANKQRGSGHAG